MSLQTFYSPKITASVVSMLASSAVDSGFEPRSGQTKHYKIVFIASVVSMQQ